MAEFVLEVPIDVSHVEDREPGAEVRVTAVAASGGLVSGTTTIGANGKGTVKLAFPDRPKGVRLYIGPGTVGAEELPKLQSLEVQVPARLLVRGNRASFEPVVVKPSIWHAWRLWCRKFKISGFITCPDGRPVPGAEVTAFDVDWWWWWLSKQPIRTATTDENGYYEMEFIWCCGYRPWWWWQSRHWRLEPGLIDRITPILRLHPDLPDPPRPTPTPDPAVFERLLANSQELGREPDPGIMPDRRLSTLRLGPSAAVFDPTRMVGLREPLLRRLPEVEELTRLRVWPWFPWRGWSDCAPDLIFRVTQDCGDEDARVLINENFLSTRWNVGTETTANLVAVDACCIDDTPQPEGDCLNLESVCNVPVSNIGGNPTAAVAAPEGYVSPTAGDRPFGGGLTIRGDFGTAANADYYELEWFDPTAPGGGAWKELPAGSLLGFNRLFHGPTLPDPPGGPVATHVAKFPVEVVGGRRVIKSRHRFQTENNAATWEVLGLGSRWWTGNTKNLLARWATDGIFADGTYRLQVVSWQLTAPDTLGNRQVLGLCGAANLQDPNELVLRIDNRIITDPTAHGDNCGAGTVHVCTDEPETRVLFAEIVDQLGNHKSPLPACSDVQIAPNDRLRVRFRASDADGHLSHYHLQATYGDNDKSVLINGGPVGTATLAPVVPGTPVGPTYAKARLPVAVDPQQGAASPIWHGGDYIVEADAQTIFPKTCCYQLELRAYKRTIVNCDGNYPHRNLSERSFMIRV